MTKRGDPGPGRVEPLSVVSPNQGTARVVACVATALVATYTLTACTGSSPPTIKAATRGPSATTYRTVIRRPRRASECRVVVVPAGHNGFRVDVDAPPPASVELDYLRDSHEKTSVRRLRGAQGTTFVVPAARAFRHGTVTIVGPHLGVHTLAAAIEWNPADPHRARAVCVGA